MNTINKSKNFYVYHIGKCGYQDIRPLKFLRGSPQYTEREKLFKEKYGNNWEEELDKYSSQINAFLGPVKKEYLELLRSRGFKQYANLANICLYTIDLLDPINFNKIEYFDLASTPLQNEYVKKLKPFGQYKENIYRELSQKLNISEFDLKDDYKFEQLPEDIKNEINNVFQEKIQNYRKEMNHYTTSRLGIPIEHASKMDLYRLTDPNNKITYNYFEDMQNTKKWFEYNAKVGNKNQYASYIPHIQITVNSPLKVAKYEKLF